MPAQSVGKILYEEHQAGATLEELAKKYGYVNRQRICEYIAIYKNREEILKRTPGSTVSFKKALKVLRELKQKKKKGS
jgi:hypothetical protein